MLGVSWTRPTVTFGSTATVDVEVVYTKAAIARGLMYRRDLAPNAGMLFILDAIKDHKFWMRNTYIPLDIIFITPDFKVAGVAANATPLTDTPRSIGQPSLYVVEVNAGWCAANNITANTPVSFSEETLNS